MLCHFQIFLYFRKKCISTDLDIFSIMILIWNCELRHWWTWTFFYMKENIHELFFCFALWEQFQAVLVHTWDCEIRQFEYWMQFLSFCIYFLWCPLIFRIHGLHDKEKRKAKYYFATSILKPLVLLYNASEGRLKKLPSN